MTKKVTKKINTKKKLSKISKIKNKILENKNKLILFLLIFMDIFLIIYVARDNVANYVNVNGKEIFVGQTKNVLLGRNYITLVISVFIYLYGLAVNKIVFLKKIDKKSLIFIFCGILLFNMVLFCIFTNRVY